MYNHSRQDSDILLMRYAFPALKLLQQVEMLLDVGVEDG